MNNNNSNETCNTPASTKKPYTSPVLEELDLSKVANNAGTGKDGGGFLSTKS